MGEMGNPTLGGQPCVYKYSRVKKKNDGKRKKLRGAGYNRFDIAIQWQMEENPHVSYSSSFI